VLVAAVDIPENRVLGTKYRIYGFPDLKWFVDGKETKHEMKDKNFNSVINWVNKATQIEEGKIEFSEHVK